ncbi:MAG: LamG-like jellyroll fold domain-containing protein [Bacteroidota bacterium]
MKLQVLKKIKNVLLLLLTVVISYNSIAQCEMGKYPGLNTTRPSGWVGNYILGSLFTGFSAGTVTHIGYKGIGGGGVRRLMLYTNSSGNPGTLVAYTNTFTAGSGQTLVPIITPTTIPAGDYWIMSNGDGLNGFSDFTTESTTATTFKYTSYSHLSVPPTTASWASTSGSQEDFYLNYDCLGAALSFDGADDDVRAFGFQDFTEYTIEGWFKLNSLVDQNLVVGTGNGNPNTWFTNQLQLNGGKFTHYLYDGSVQTISSPIVPLTGVWYHVAIVAKNGTPVRIYVNGTPSVSTSNVGSISGANEYRLAGTGAGLPSFSGEMDEVRIWNVSRTQCEINTFMNCEIPTSATSLLANFHFNQGLNASPNPTVTTLMDASGNGHNGSLINFALTGATSNWIATGAVISGYTTTLAPPAIAVNSGSIIGGSSFTMTPNGGVSYTYSPSGPIVTPSISATYTVAGTAASSCTNSAVSVVSVQGAAINFDGSNDIVNLGNGITTSLNGSSKVSVEAWVKPTSFSGLGCIAGNYSTGAGALQILLRRSGNSYYEFWVGNGGTWYNTNSVATPTLNVWQHVAATWNGTVASIYVNGVLSGTTTPAIATLGNASNNPVWLGGNTVNESFAGNIDEVRIWNRTLCQSEIQNNMNGEIATSATGLIGNYHFNQGFSAFANPTVTTLTDASGNGNNGTLTNFALTGATSNWVAPGAVVTGSTVVVFSSTVSATAVTTSVNCNGTASGSATITATGGTPYTYSWSPSGGTASVASGLAAGNYSVLVMNVCGASTTVTLNIAAPPALSTSIAFTNVLCNGGTGSATISVTGGTSPYSYLASNGTTVAAQSGLMPGSYNFTVTDANGCESVKPATITQPSALSTSTAVTNVLCNGGTGSATISVTGGTSPYSYLASNGATVAAQSGLMAGSYQYTVTDANECTNVKVATISEPTALTANSTASAILCNGGMSSVTVTATGGTPSYSGIGTFTAMAGVQTYTVIDDNGCSATTSISISEPVVLTASLTASSILCNGGISTVTLTAFDGTPSYSGIGTFTVMAGAQTYTVIDDNGCSATTSISISEPAAITSVQSFTLCEGESVMVSTSTYSATGTFTNVIASLINGCDSTITTDILINSLPTVTVNSEAICIGQSFTMTPGGASTYTYSNGSSVTMPTADDTYTVTGTDVNGCENTAVSSLTVNALPTLSVSSTSTLICTGETATLSVTGASTYTWSTNETTSDIAVNPTAQSTYTVNATDGNGCVNSISIMQDVSLCTGIVSNNLMNSGLNIYPNPNNGMFTVKSDRDLNLHLTNALGQVIETIILNDSNNHQMNVNVLSNGVYFITGQNNNQSVKQKVIVAR